MENSTQWKSKWFSKDSKKDSQPTKEGYVGEVQRKYPKPQIGIGGIAVLAPPPPNPNLYSKPSYSENILDTQPEDENRFNQRDDYDPNVILQTPEEVLRETEVKFGIETDPLIVETAKATESEEPENPVLAEVKNDMMDDLEASKNNIKERFRQLVTGVDYEHFTIDQFRILIRKIVNFFPDLIDTCVHSVAMLYVNMFYLKIDELSKLNEEFSKKNPVVKEKNEDIYVVKKQLYCILAIPLTLLISYNWWFLFSSDIGYIPIGKQIDENSASEFLVGLNMKPLSVLNYLLLGFKEGNTGKSITKLLSRFSEFKCLFMFGFIVFTYFALIRSTPYFKQTMNDVIDSKQNKMYSVVFTIVVLAFVFNKILFMDKPIVPKVFAIFKVITSPITFIITLIVRFLVILIMMPISMFGIMLYLIFLSFGGILFNTGDWSGTLHNIDYEIRHVVPDADNTNCFIDPWYIKLLRGLNVSLYSYRMYIIYGIVLIMNMVTTLGEMKSNSMRMSVFGFYLILLLLYGILMLFKLRHDWPNIHAFFKDFIAAIIYQWRWPWKTY
jgi:hypothetical protein